MKAVCSICNRSASHMVINTKYGKPLCREHDTHFNKYGKFFKWNINNENEYLIDGDITKIILRNVTMDIVGEAIIDTKHLDKVIKYKWKTDKSNYVRNVTSNISLHELIIGKIDGKIIDHENRNRRDCRESNLRHVTHQLNGINKGTQSNNTSGHVGVSWDKRRDKWESHIKLDSKKKFLGYFTELEDAVKARLDGELKYFGFNVDRSKDCNTVFK